MLGTAERDSEVIDAEFTTDEPTTAVSRLECPVALPVVNDLRAKYSGLMISGINDKSGLAAVDEARRHCKRVRVQVENWRKEQNEDALKHQRRVNAAAKLIREPLELLEETLAGRQKAITDEVEALKRAAEEKLKARMDELQAVRAYLPPLEVEAMSDESFAILIADKQRYEFERIESEKVEKQRQADEAERQRVEREKLAAERAELDRQKKEQDDQQRKLDEAHQLAANRERERIEAEQQRERDRIAAIERQRDEAEKARLELERESVARVRAEQLRPDKEKLFAFADAVDHLAATLPEVSPSISFAKQLIFQAVTGAATQVRQIVATKVK